MSRIRAPLGAGLRQFGQKAVSTSTPVTEEELFAILGKHLELTWIYAASKESDEYPELEELDEFKK